MRAAGNVLGLLAVARVGDDHRLVGADRGGRLCRDPACDPDPTSGDELRGLATRARQSAAHQLGVKPRPSHAVALGGIEVGEGVLQPAMNSLVVRDMLARGQVVEFTQRGDGVVDSGHAGWAGRLPADRLVNRVIRQPVDRLIGQLDAGVLAHDNQLTGPRRRVAPTTHSPAVASADVTTVDECDRAIKVLASRFGTDGGSRSGGLDRSVSATVTDLGLHYRGHMHDGVLDDIAQAADDEGPAQIRLTMTADDLLAMASGELSVGSAWLSGRLKVHASLPDMLRVRAML